jgi:hypothetical protein
MNDRTVRAPNLGICLLVLTLAYPSKGHDAVAGNADVGPIGGSIRPPIATATLRGSTVPAQAGSSSSCLPRYGEPQFILRVNETSPYGYEPFVTSGDFDGDSLEDVVITEMTFQTMETYELDILLNDGNESLVLATSSITFERRQRNCITGIAVGTAPHWRSEKCCFSGKRGRFGAVSETPRPTDWRFPILVVQLPASVQK